MAKNDLKIQQRHLWEQIAEELRRSIHSGDLAPGSRLVTADLATKWGVSRGPVREALMALENEGIVQGTRRHGMVVRTPSVLDFQEIFSVREALESAAGNVLCGAASPLTETDIARLSEKLDNLDKARSKGDNNAAAKYDFTFHQALVDFTGNSRFSSINRHMISQNTQHLKGLDPEFWPQTHWAEALSAHRAILDALAARDLDAYRVAISEHYLIARQRASPTEQSRARGDGAPLLVGAIHD